jgi:archaellum biogenesis protein FlaJ (TadC family)
MKLYRQLFWTIFSWYRDWNGPDKWPDAWAATILSVLHLLNIVTIVVIAVPSSADVYAFYKRTLIIPLVLPLIIYVWYFVSNADRIDEEFRDVDVLARRRMWLGFLAYAFVTVVAFGVCLVWRLSRRMPG